MNLVLKSAQAVAISSLLVACGEPTPTETAPSEETAPRAVANDTIPVAVAPISKAEEAADPEEAPKAKPTAPQGAGMVATAAPRFGAWGAVHALIGSTIKIGISISDEDALALTADNLVGVTTNGGQNWGFTRHDNGTVLALGGKPGGPYFAVGKAGYASISLDGRIWSDLARHTNEDLTSIAVGSSGAVVTTKSGAAYVQYSADGKTGRLAGWPEKFKARSVSMDGAKFSANVGKLPLVSTDGRTWALSDTPEAKVAKSFATAQGVCGTGRVEKVTGVVCEVKGQGFGTSAGTVVIAKDTFFTSTNGGNSWNASMAPMKAANGIVAAGGNLVAFGNAGLIAISDDGGKGWIETSLELKKSLKAALVDGNTVLLGGDGGIIARSTNAGASFQVIETPQTGAIKQLAKLSDGRIVASLGAKGIESTDGGATWTDMLDPVSLAELVPPAKAGKCEGRMPADGEVCAIQKTVTSPLGLPNVRGLNFNGKDGLAWGDFGLVMMTGNGGASWAAQSGFGVKSFDTFELRDQVILGIGGKDVVISRNGGKSFTRHLLPKTAGRIEAAQISKDGKVLLAVGKTGTIARAFIDAPDDWQLLDVGNVAGGGKKVTANFEALYELGATPEAGGLLFAVGARGELFRSENRGDSWVQIATGTSQSIQRLAAEGETVVAITMADRKGGNLLLKSDDGGRHFYIAREISHSGSVDVFSLVGGTLTYRDRVSNDFGATWTKEPDSKYWSGAEEVGDGSGLRIVNHPSRYVRDTIYLVGTDKDDWLIMDGVQTKMARFECAASGCWMLHDGQFYRPL